MKFIFAGVVLLFSTSAWSYSAVEIFPLQLQFRYEETSAQSKETISYQSFSGYLQFDFHRWGLTYNRHQNETGNSSFNIQTEKKEYFGVFGYRFFRIEEQIQKLSLEIFADAIFGMTQSSVATTLLGTVASSTSNQEQVYGLGSAIVGRLSYFMLETDFHILTSKAFSPQYVPEVTFKAGFNIILP